MGLGEVVSFDTRPGYGNDGWGEAGGEEEAVVSYQWIGGRGDGIVDVGRAGSGGQRRSGAGMGGKGL